MKSGCESGSTAGLAAPNLSAVRGKKIDRLTLDANEDGQSKTDEENDKHEDKVTLGECVEPHGCQPVE